MAKAAVKTSTERAFEGATFDAPLFLHFLTKRHEGHTTPKTTTATAGSATAEGETEKTALAANVVRGIHVGNARAARGAEAIAAIICAPGGK